MNRKSSLFALGLLSVFALVGLPVLASPALACHCNTISFTQLIRSAASIPIQLSTVFTGFAGQLGRYVLYAVCERAS